MELAGLDVRDAWTTRACPADQRLLRAPPPFSLRLRPSASLDARSSNHLALCTANSLGRLDNELSARENIESSIAGSFRPNTLSSTCLALRHPRPTPSPR